MTRYEEALEDDLEVDVVPVEGITNLIKFMSDIGFCDYGESGAKPFSPADMRADLIGFGVELSVPEWREARRLSAIYANAVHEFKNNVEAIPPYGFDEIENAKANAELARLLGDK